MEKTTMGQSDTTCTTGTIGATLISSMSSTSQPSASTSSIAEAAAANNCPPPPSPSPPSSRHQTSNSLPRKGSCAEITTATATATAMAHGSVLSLESLPLEVIHQIFSLLIPGDLASLRLTSHTLCSSATSNPHWRRHFTDLIPAHAALLDVAAVPLSAWSFAYAQDGYFRAYTTLVRTAREAWLHSDQDLKGTQWIVFFKSFLREGGARSDDPNYNTLVEMKADCTSIALEGLPLNSSRWYVDGAPSLRFPCYPPNVPSRDPFTWCRVMQHTSVLMLTDSPDLLQNLIHLNTSILEASKQPEAQARIKMLKGTTDKILEDRKKDFFSRLKRLHHLRSDRNSSNSAGCSNAELPEADGVANGAGPAAVNDEVGKRLESSS